MAAGYTGATNIAELIPEITDAVQFIYQDRAIGPDIVTFRDVTNIPGTIVEFPRFTEVAGSTAAGETAAPASHQMDLSMPTLTLGKRAVYVGLADLARKGATGDIVGQIGQAMAMAKAKQDDNAIFGVLSGTTNYATSAGATNADPTPNSALDALNQLELNEVDDVTFCVMHPYPYNKLRQLLTPVANDDGIAIELASAMARSAFESTAFGMNWFVTNRIGSTTVDATSNVYQNLVFSSRGIGYAHSWGQTAGVELDRQAKLALSDLVLNYFDSSGVIYDSAVCGLWATSS